MNTGAVAKCNVALVYIISFDNKNNFVSRFVKAMEKFHKVIGAVIFVLVFGGGVISSLSFLLLTTNSGFCNGHHWDRTSMAVTCLLVSLGVLEGINFIKHLVLTCQTYDQCWPKGFALAWILISSALSTTGLCTLMFYLLPRLDLVRAVAMLASFALLPMIARCRQLSSSKDETQSKHKPLFAVCMVLQVVAICILIFHNFTNTEYTKQSNMTSQRRSLVWKSPSLDSFAILTVILLVPFFWIHSYVIDNDINILGKVIPMANFRNQLRRSRHKAGMVMPLWKSLWVALYLFAFMPGYFGSDISCGSTSAHITAEEKQVLISNTKSTLADLLRIDEAHGNIAKPTLSPEDYIWQERAEQHFHPERIPPRNLHSEPMVPTHEIVVMLEELPSSSGSRAKLDHIILRGRYSKLTIKTYVNFISYLDGKFPSKSVEKPESEKADQFAATYRALTITMVCSSVAAVLAAKAACQWKLTRVGYLIPVCLVIPVSLTFATLQCRYPSPGLAPLLRCGEDWSVKSLTLIIICVAWISSQILLLWNSYQNNPELIQPSSDFSNPLVASSLMIGRSDHQSKKGSSKSIKIFQSSSLNKSYKFSFIKKQKDSESDGDGEDETVLSQNGDSSESELTIPGALTQH